MKIDILESPKKPVLFPKLMKGVTGTVVLFKEEGKGTIVFSSKPNYSIGDYVNNWDMRDFVDFSGQINLRNL